jgi:hypothetical protein
MKSKRNERNETKYYETQRNILKGDITLNSEFLINNENRLASDE